MKFTHRYLGFLMLALVAFTFWRCTPRTGKITAEPVDIEIQRFEQDLFRISVYDLADSIPWLLKKYPQFFPLFGARVIEIGQPGNAQFNSGLLAFVSDFTIYRVSGRIKEVYPSMESYQLALGEAFGRYMHYFPQSYVPRIFTCISGFNQSIITSDSLLAISLDKYLGSESEFYKLLYPPVPEYLKRTMRSERIVPDVLKAWLLTEYPFPATRSNLVDYMIYQGRAMYALNELLPDTPDTLLWGYSPEQLEFCKVHEAQMWEFMVEHKKLFISESFAISQYINDAPFTKDFSQESPGRAAVWQGYRIVESYMRHNPVSMEELVKEDDFQRILNLSKYNP